MSRYILNAVLVPGLKSTAIRTIDQGDQVNWRAACVVLEKPS